MTRRRQPRIRGVGYALLAFTGALAMWLPSPSIQAATGLLVYVWAAFLLVGGAASAWGALSDWWLGEYAGLPLLVAVCIIYALIVALQARSSGSVAAAFLLAVGGLLAARWQDVSALRADLAGAVEHDR